MTGIEFQIDNFLLYCSSKRLSRKTLASYEQSLKLFASYLQNELKIEDIEKVQSGHIRLYIKYLQERGKYSVVGKESSRLKNYPQNRTDQGKEISVTTIANYVRIIKVFFNFLFSIEKEIKKNPVEIIETPKPSRMIKKILTNDELRMVFGQFDVTTFHGYRNWMITRLLLDCGGRINEILATKIEDYDFRNKSILLTDTKSKHERYVYFSFKIGAELKRWLKYHDRYTDSPYMFPTNRGTRLDPRNYGKALRDAGMQVNVQIHPSLLRNNFSKHYLLNGGEWFSLSRILGHSSPEVTMKHYLDFTDEEIGRKYQKHSPFNHLDL